jgi:hypothetical protein
MNLVSPVSTRIQLNNFSVIIAKRRQRADPASSTRRIAAPASIGIGLATVPEQHIDTFQPANNTDDEDGDFTASSTNTSQDGSSSEDSVSGSNEPGIEISNEEVCNNLSLGLYQLTCLARINPPKPNDCAEIRKG